MKKITIKTSKLKEIVDITPQVEKILQQYPAEDGMIHFYLRHSTAALTTAYIAEGVDLDMLGTFEVMLPAPSLARPHDQHTHQKAHLPAHILASMLGPHLAVPVENNQLQLGKFQSLVLVELNGPKAREVIIDYRLKG